MDDLKIVKSEPLTIKHSEPMTVGFTRPPEATGPDPRTDWPTLAGSTLKAPGMGESLATLPMMLADFLPGVRIAKPLTVPLAGTLGGLGEGAEQLFTDKPFNISDILGAILRQGGIEGVGRGVEGAARPLMALGLPGAKKQAVTAALEEGIGRNLNKARSVSGTLSEQVANRVAPMQIPLDEALAPTSAAINKAVGESPRPIDTYRALTDELNAIKGQNAPVLSGAEALAKKRGAGRGFEATARKELAGREVQPPSVIEEALRSGLKTAMEERDPVQGLLGQPLRRLNERSGNVAELIKYLDPAQKREPLSNVLGMLSRSALGGAIGGGAGALTGSNNGAGEGAALGALLAANPGAAALSARVVRRAGQALPPLVRGTSVTIDSLKRRPLNEAK